MTLLLTYVLCALIISFLCSVAESVMLSVNTAYIAHQQKEKKPFASILWSLKADINKPLAAILSLNTFAHTLGAAAAGAQAAYIFGSAYLGIASAILTLLILIFSEIIPKTLAAYYWRQLAPVMAYSVRVLIWFMYPFVMLSEKMTNVMFEKPQYHTFSRQEFIAMAELGEKEGKLAQQETRMLKNLLRLYEVKVVDVMTPRTVVFSLDENMSVDDFFSQYHELQFSRIPIYKKDEHEHLSGFVRRDELLMAQAQGHVQNCLHQYKHELTVIVNSISLLGAFNKFITGRFHMAQIVDEYGGVEGIITLEDIFETLLGLEIIDESDKVINMQRFARTLWLRRAKKMGIPIDKNT